MKSEGQAEQDGRRRRSIASRDRIIDAVIALVDADQGIPGAEAIAEQAGVGLRSVFRHFGDMDGLYTAVLDRVGRRYVTIVRPYEASTWQGQVAEAMARRLGMYEGILPYRRAADMHRQRSPLLAHGLDALNMMLRARLEGILPNDLRADALWFEQLDLWLSLEAYGRLRDRQALDHGRASGVIKAAVDALLATRG
jgi:AcrR family transcriptional regulator